MKQFVSACLAAAFLLSGASFAQQNDSTPEVEATPEIEAKPDAEATSGTEAPMDLARLGEIVQGLDENAEIRGTQFFLTVADVPVVIVSDPGADRMRALVPIRSAEGIEPAELMRLMQANFDTALDARYAVAQGRIWAAFIHPLSALKKDQLISGIGQTVNLARTYGTLYSGGAMSYGAGDSQGLLRGLIDELLKKGEEI